MEKFIETARAIVAAEDALSDAQAGHLAAIECHGKIGARLTALAAEKDAIVTRRMAGDLGDGDGAWLALIDADSDGLRRLLADAGAAMEQARIARTQAEAKLAARKRELQTAEDLEALGAVGARADQLIQLLGEALAQRQAIADRLPADLAPQLLALQVRRGQALEGIFLRELVAVCGRGAAIYANDRPKWPPAKPLYELVGKLHYNAGNLPVI